MLCLNNNYIVGGLLIKCNTTIQSTLTYLSETDTQCQLSMWMPSSMFYLVTKVYFTYKTYICVL